MKSDKRWLEKYSDALQGRTALELGCGPGIDSVAIAGYTDFLVSGDLSPRSIPNSSNPVISLDHARPLPFGDASFDVVIASLCLHYFPIDTLREINNEIARVLKPIGLFICRLNSYKDTHYGATGYPEIEPGLYSVNGQQKRFFHESEIRDLWSGDYRIHEITFNAIDRYRYTKYIYEFSASRV